MSGVILCSTRHSNSIEYNESQYPSGPSSRPRYWEYYIIMVPFQLKSLVTPLSVLQDLVLFSNAYHMLITIWIYNCNIFYLEMMERSFPLEMICNLQLIHNTVARLLAG